MSYTEEEIKQAVKDIMDVFSGADGGVKFTIFYHQLLPDIIAKQDSNDRNFKKALDAIVLVSRLVDYDYK